MPQQIASRRAGRKEWIGLAVLTLPALLTAMDLSVLFMAVPQLTAALEPSGTQLLWIMDIYGFLIAGLLITMGTVGDRIGRRKLLLIGATAFGAASVLAAFSTTAQMLIVARALLGIGGATLAPSTLALIRNTFHDARQRRTAIAIWTGAFTAGFPLGAIVGGLLVEYFWWGSVFLINIPVMVLLIALAPVLLPEYQDPEAGRLDLISAVLSIAAMLTVIWGLKKLAADGWTISPMAAVAVGLILGYVFVRRQRTSRDPLLDVRLFTYPAFSASIGANMILLLASAGVGMLVVQYLQLGLGYSPLVAALWMLPMIAGTVAGVAWGTIMARWARPVVIVGSGLATTALGMGGLCFVVADGSIATLLAGHTVLGVGMGMVVTMVTNLVIATAPPQRAGAAAAVNEAGAELGGALGIASLGSIAGGVYTARMAEATADLPDAGATAAAETLGGAAAVADELPSYLGQPLLRAAREAFIAGFTTTALVGTVVVAVCAVLAIFALRHVRLEGDR